MGKLPTYEALTRIAARCIGLSPEGLRQALQPATLAEFDAVVDFRRRFLHVAISWNDADYLRWRYGFGRAGCGIAELWRLRRGDEILAVLGVEPVRCELDGRIYDGARGMDLLVRHDLRETGVGVWLNQTMLEQHEYGLAMGANESSAGIVQRMYRPLSPRLTYTYPLDLRPFIHRRWPGAPLLTSAAATVANMGLSVWRRRPRRPLAAGIRITAATRFFEHDIPTQAALAGQVRVVRTADYLNRRLVDNPRCRYEVRLAADDRGAVGYLVWAQQPDADGCLEMSVSDWQCDRPQTLAALLQSAVHTAAQLGCSCIRVVVQDEASRKEALSIGFMPSRGDRGKLAGVQSRDADIVERLSRAEWALTDATNDIDGY